MNRRTVLHVVEPLATGIIYSISRICRSLAEDFDFHVLHGVRQETPEDYKERFPAGTHFHLWNVQREIRPVKDVKALAELKSTVTRIRPDVIHAHASKAGALARIAYRNGGPPVLYSPRGFSFLRKDVSGVHRLAFRVLERVLAGRNTITVACGLSEYQESVLNRTRTLYVPNVVETVDIRAKPRRGAALEAIMVGGIRPQKNFRLFAAIAADPRVSSIRFTWIGGGELPHGIPLSPNLEVTGWLPRAEVLRRLSSADVFVQTSLWEGLPVGMLEAMMLGLPVLAYPARGNTELVIDGHNGFLCVEVADFVERLVEFESNQHARCLMGDRGRKLVETEHSPECADMRWHSMYTYPDRYLAHSR